MTREFLSEDSPEAAAATCEEAADRPRVLIVDDERGPRESLRMILSSSYAVDAVASGTEALDHLRTEPIDLVTVDLNMPGMKGDELMRSIRSEFPQVELIIITGCGSLETAVEGLRYGVSDYLTKPFDVVQVTAAVARALDRRANRSRMATFLEGIGRVLGQGRDSSIVLEELEASPIAQARLRAVLEEPTFAHTSHGTTGGGLRTIEFLEVLAETIENRDLFMRGHARRVAFYADLLAAAVCMSREEREHVRLAGFLHDIGKVGSPSDLLAGRAMPEPERLESIEGHSAIGERLLRPLGLEWPVATTVRHHHERYDGEGYPDGLAGEDIPLASRLIAIADAYDAMTCERPYRRARSREEAILELRNEAGRQFDPDLAGIFCELVATGATDAVGEPDDGTAEIERLALRLANQGAA